MINPKSEGHPYYELTENIKKVYPEESKKWEKLLHDIINPQNKGCFTCKFYNPPANEFCDVESVDPEVDDEWLPWDTEQAYVDCDKTPVEQMALKIKCYLWKPYNQQL